MKLFKEFREFISKGNVIDLAVGIMIGGAFQNIITSFIDNLIMPIISLITGGFDLTNSFIILSAPNGVDTSTLKSLQAALDAGCSCWQYGAFITAVINFLIMAIVIFLMVKGINTAKNKLKKPVEEEPTTKVCPFCKEEIPIDATRCKYCTSEQPKDK